MNKTHSIQGESPALHVLDDLKDIVFEVAYNKESSPTEVIDWVTLVLNQALEDFMNGNAEKRIDQDITSLRAQILVALNHFDALGISHEDSVGILKRELGNVLRNTLMDRISKIPLPKNGGKNRRASRVA